MNALRLEEALAASELANGVAKKHGLTLEALRGPCRARAHVQARAELYLLLRARGWSYPQIARAVCRDHSTVLAHCNPAVAARKKHRAATRATRQP